MPFKGGGEFCGDGWRGEGTYVGVLKGVQLVTQVSHGAVLNVELGVSGFGAEMGLNIS
jgi:hypothetical protein